MRAKARGPPLGAANPGIESSMVAAEASPALWMMPRREIILKRSFIVHSLIRLLCPVREGTSCGKSPSMSSTHLELRGEADSDQPAQRRGDDGVIAGYRRVVRRPRVE